MIGVIIQARTGSSRFPRKIYEDINGKCTLARVLEGVQSAVIPHKIILAMPEYDAEEFSTKLSSCDFAGVNDGRMYTYYGSPDDVLDRYFQAARRFDIDLIARVTADCPLIQGKIIDQMLIEYLKKGYNSFMGNNETVSSLPYPDGTDVEIFPYWMLAEAWQLAKCPSQREHVTPFMYRRATQYNIHEFKNCRPNPRITMKFPNFSFDTAEDLRLLQAITKEYDKHGDLHKALMDTNFQRREWRNIK